MCRLSSRLRLNTAADQGLWGLMRLRRYHNPGLGLAPHNSLRPPALSNFSGRPPGGPPLAPSNFISLPPSMIFCLSPATAKGSHLSCPLWPHSISSV